MGVQAPSKVPRLKGDASSDKKTWGHSARYYRMQSFAKSEHCAAGQQGQAIAKCKSQPRLSAIDRPSRILHQRAMQAFARIEFPAQRFALTAEPCPGLVHRPRRCVQHCPSDYGGRLCRSKCNPRRPHQPLHPQPQPIKSQIEPARLLGQTASQALVPHPQAAKQKPRLDGRWPRGCQLRKVG